MTWLRSTGSISATTHFSTRQARCLIGVFGSIAAPAVPVTHPRCCIVVNLSGEPGERVSLEIDVHGPENEAVVTSKEPADITLGQGGETTSVFAVNSLPLEGFGVYRVTVSTGGVCHELPFSVVRAAAGGGGPVQ